MKNQLLIISGILLSIVLSFQVGIFQRYNFITAYFDKWAGVKRIVYYGEMDELDSVKIVKAKSLHFEYKRIGGCNVSRSLIYGADAYNSVMTKAINEQIGGNWNEMISN